MDIQSAQIDDVNKSTETYIRQNYMAYVIAYVVVCAALIGIVLWFDLSPQLFIVPLLIGVVGYQHIRTKIKQEFTKEFGASIGFAYSPQADMSTVSGKLFSAGHSQRMYDILTGTYNTMPTRIFSYQFTVGYGKDSHSYSNTVYESAFPNTMPDIVLRSGAYTILSQPLTSGKDERIQLEGDFNKYFTLTVPKGYETEAYQIFPPDVMADLIDRARGLDFEFCGNKLYVYVPRLVIVRSDLQSMFDLSEYLANLFSKSAHGVNIQSSVASVPAMN